VANEQQEETNMRHRVAFCAAALTLGLTGSQALAQEAAVGGSSFGRAGTLAVGAERMFGFARASIKVKQEQPPSDEEQTTTVNRFSFLGRTHFSTQFPSPYSTPRIGIDFFPIDGLSFGGSLTYVSESGETESESPAGSQSEDTDPTSGFLISPRVGYGVMFTDVFGIWPRAGITYFTANEENINAMGQTTSESNVNGLAFTLEVPLILSPINHVGFTIGPTLDIPLSGSSENDPTDPADPTTEFDVKITDIGISAGLLVWF
jgi:hypothetical protein